MSAEAIKTIDDAIKANDTDEIILDDIKIAEISPELKKKLESLEEVSVLSLNNCKLRTLVNFPQIQNLIRLELMENNFPASELKHIATLKDLQSLSLSDNQSNIKSVDDLKALSSLALAQLDLSGTDLAKQDDYRDKVFALFTDLQILDNKDKDGNEVEYDEDDIEDEEGDENDDNDDFEDAEVDDEDELDDEEDDEDEEGEDYDDDDDEDDEPKNKRNKK